MATGTYGTIRPADVSPEDVDIILHYTPSRDVTNNLMQHLFLDLILIMEVLVVMLTLKFWVVYII